MAITKMNTSTVLNTDMRDTGGHYMKVMTINSFEGTYEAGGVVINPAWLGMQDLVFVQTTASSAWNVSGEGEPWTLLSFNSIMPVTVQVDEDSTKIDWHMVIFMNNGDGTYSELPDGSALNFPDGLTPVIMVIGS